jgi:hypothetical protein
MVGHRVVNVSAVMCRKVVPNENSMEIGAWDIVCLSIHANVVAKIPKNIGGSANGMQTSDPSSRTLETSANMCRQGRIPRLNCKDDSHLDAVVVVPILTDTLYHYGPPPHAVTLFQRHLKLVEVNHPLSGHLEHTKRRKTAPKPPHVKLHVRVLHLIGFN